MNFRIQLKLSIVSTILFVIMSLSIAMLISLWLISSKVAETIASDLFNTTSHSTQEKIQGLMDASLKVAAYGSTLPDIDTITGDGLSSPKLPFLLKALQQDESLYSIYYGLEDSSFYQVIAAKNNQMILDAHSAPKDTHWIVRTIAQKPGATDESPKVQTWSFLDIDKNNIAQHKNQKSEYNPRIRPWYKASFGQETPKLSSSYIFSSLQMPGITASAAMSDNSGVFGVDMVLDGLDDFVTNQYVSKNGGIVLFDEKLRIMASTPNLGDHTSLSDVTVIENPLIRAVISEHQQNDTVKFDTISHGNTQYLLSISSTNFDGSKIYSAIIAPQSDFVGHIRDMQMQLLYLCLAGLIIFMPLAYFFSSRLSKSVTDLTDDAERVRTMDFSQDVASKSRIIEFHDLSAAFQHMKSSLHLNTKALEVSQEKLSRLVELGIAMSAEQRSSKLMEMVLLGAKELTNADGGTLYTIKDDDKLQFQIIRNDSLGIEMGGSSGNPINFPGVPLFDEDGNENHKNVVSHTVHQQETVNVTDAYNNDDFDFSGTKAFDEANGYRSQSFLTVPLKPRGGDIIGALQIINATNPITGEVEAFSPAIQRFIEALAAQAATALYNRELLRAQEELMDSLIQLLAGAIDTKSPYTGGHCERVPELAMLLADAASKSNIG